MRGRIENRFVYPTVCLSERPLIRLAALDTFSPRGEGSGGAQSLPPSGGRWHPASHGSRMTDEGAYREQIRLSSRLPVGTSPSSVSLRSTPSPQRGEGSGGAPASWPRRRFRCVFPAPKKIFAILHKKQLIILDLESILIDGKRGGTPLSYNYQM